jgi:transposase
VVVFQTPNTAIAVIGIDIGKNSFNVVGHDGRGAIVLRQKWSRGQVEARPANMPPCLIGMEACVGAHHLSRKLASLGHDARLMPAKYVRPYSKGQKNDFNDAEAIAASRLFGSKEKKWITPLLLDPRVDLHWR